jgi:2-iminobutanoate/2-iminopropanoate deaminase
MCKTEVRHRDAHVSTGAYSAAVLVDGWLYASGQGPIDLKTGDIITGTIEEETRLTLDNVGRLLAAAECAFSTMS